MKKTDLFVIDTNILISAFILPKSGAQIALNKARKLGVVVVSDSLIDELTEVLVRPKFDKYLSLDIRIEIIDDFISLAHFVKPDVTINLCRDPKDNKFLELACFTNAKCIISGDQDLLIMHPFQGVPIKTISDFLRD